MDDQIADLWEKLLTNKRLGEYQIAGKIGTGYFSLVFEAEREKQRYALKFLPPQYETGEFTNEGTLLARLSGATSVVALHESATVPYAMSAEGIEFPMPVSFHIMELATGCLDELVEDEAMRERLAWAERLQLWRGVIRGVHQMHRKNIVHRDLKSGNCLLFERKRYTECKVADLGRSKDTAAAPIHADYSIGMGDRRFAAPEHIWHQGTSNPEHHRLADLYGLSSVLFELSMGVGLTHYALGTLAETQRRADEDMAANRSLDLATLAPLYESAFEDFEESLPLGVRKRLGQVMRRMANPDRARRCAQNPSEAHRLARTDLSPLFREIDLMIRFLTLTEK